MPEKTLMEFMRGLQERFGKNGDKATYDRLAEVLGVSTATVGNLRKGRPSKRDVIVEMADHALLRRTDFLEAAGYIPSEEDQKWDDEHFTNEPTDRQEDEGQHPVPLSVFISALSRIGRIVPLDTLPLANATLPCSLPIHREGETLEDFTFLSEAEGVFGVIVEGDSMIPYYHQGDCVIARPFDGEYEKDRHYIVLIDNDLTCKALEEWRFEEDRMLFTFAPANSKYPRITASQDRVIFQGVVVASLPKGELAKARRAAEGKRSAG